jgi:hypothetical protein
MKPDVLATTFQPYNQSILMSRPTPHYQQHLPALLNHNFQLTPERERVSSAVLAAAACAAAGHAAVAGAASCHDGSAGGAGG